jgi:hypothetical protein
MDSGMSTRISKKGWLSCFCKEKVNNGRRNYDETLYPSEKHPDLYICNHWEKITRKSITAKLSGIYEYMSVIINFLLRLGFVTFCELFVPFCDVSEKQEFINNRIWFLLFLQLGVMLLFASWNSRELADIKWFGGIYTDFNRYWFKDVGQFFVSTMIKNAFWPFIEFFLL